MKNLEKVTLELNIYHACRTNTGRAYSNDSMHYNFPFLAQISGARFENTLSDLEWCAKNKEDEMAIKAIQYLAEALLSAYEIQRKTY